MGRVAKNFNQSSELGDVIYITGVGHDDDKGYDAYIGGEEVDEEERQKYGTGKQWDIRLDSGKVVDIKAFFRPGPA